MKIAYQGCFRNPNGSHSTIWNVDRHYLDALAKVDSKNSYLLFNYALWNPEGRGRLLANPNAPNFKVSMAHLSRKGVEFAERLGWDVRGWVLRRKGAELLHISEQIYPAPLRFPTVVTFYDLIPELFPEWSTPASIPFMRLNARRARHLIACSESTKKDLERVYGIPEQRVTVIPCGIDRNIFKPPTSEQTAECRRRLGLPAEFVLCVGPFTPRKNLDSVLKAFPAWKRSRPGLGLVFVGSRAYRYEELRRAAGETGLKEIFFTGELEQNDLAAVYGAATLFVFPSLYEGFGLPLLEAMACGCPVAASENSSIPEVIGDAGILFKSGDDSAMSRAVQDLLERPEQRAELSRRGLARTELFTWEAAAAKHLALYETLVESLRPRT